MWTLVAETLVRAIVIVIADILFYAVPKLSWVCVLYDVSVFALQATEPSLNYYVVNPSRLAVHALSDFVSL